MDQVPRTTKPAKDTDGTEIKLSFKNWTLVPPEQIAKIIEQSESATCLQLHLNKLTALPEEIYLLSKLTSFHAWENRITEISPKIEQLKHLHTLKLNSNNLEKIPATIGALTCLTGIS